MLPSDPDRPTAVDPSGDPTTDVSPAPITDRPSGLNVPVTPVYVHAPPARRLPVFGLAVAVVAVFAGVALFLSGYSVGSRQAGQPGTPASDDQIFEPFWNAYRTIVDRYAGGEVDKSKLVEGAIKGMVDSLQDPYSSYLTPEEFQQTLQGISGQFEGIGAEIGTQDAAGKTIDCATLGPSCRLVIIAPIEGSPAQKAGLKPGDVVLGVDGSSLDGSTVDAARDRIRGRKGTEVRLSIARAGGQPFDVPIVRDVIVQREVIARDLAGGSVGYVRLTGFSDNAARELHKQLADDVAAGRTKLILDLRGNPGGFVTAARDVASDFVGSGVIFWQEDSKGKKTATNAEGGGAAIDPGIQVVVLIDRGSASASEIVAGALQDRQRATIVGETSFGKGTVQEWTTLDGAGGVRLTVAKWLTPDQHWVHHVGVRPDVPVTVPADNPADADPALDRALEVLHATAGLGLGRAA